MRSKDDDRLRHKLENKLSNQGLRAPCRLTVEIYHETATLTGNVLYDYQKRAAIQAARSMDGIRGVIDRIKVQPPIRGWDEEPHSAAHHAPDDTIEPMPGPADSPEKSS